MENDQEIEQVILCPVCRHASHDILYQVNARTTAEHMFHFGGSAEEVQHLMELITSMWGGDTANMLKCKNCQLIFADPFLAGSNEFYSAIYQVDNYYPDWKWDYEITYRDFQAQSRKMDLKDTHLLEVGAGNGSFVKRLVADFFRQENLLCTEYSDFGVVRINELGIRCISGPLNVLKTPENKGRFQFICMFQVLEHMDHLHDLFETFYHLSHKGTILYITVPSEAYRAYYDRLGRHMDTPPNHITRWNKNSFTRLGEEFGWSVKEQLIQPMSYSEKLKKLIFDRLEFHGVFRSSKWAEEKLSFVRKAGLALAAGCMILVYFRAVFRLRDPGLGISQWVKFVKE